VVAATQNESTQTEENNEKNKRPQVKRKKPQLKIKKKHKNQKKITLIKKIRILKEKEKTETKIDNPPRTNLNSPLQREGARAGTPTPENKNTENAPENSLRKAPENKSNELKHNHMHLFSSSSLVPSSPNQARHPP
jgi:hypothetical protein